MTWRLSSVAIAVVFGIGCSRKEPPPPASPLAQALQQAGQAANQAGQAANQAGQTAQASAQTAQQATANLAQAMKMLNGQNAAGARVEPVNFRELKALLPEELPGFKRTDAKGEKAGAMGMVVSQASADYAGA